jgi:hypothetical protein
LRPSEFDAGCSLRRRFSAKFALLGPTASGGFDERAEA